MEKQSEMSTYAKVAEILFEKNPVTLADYVQLHKLAEQVDMVEVFRLYFLSKANAKTAEEESLNAFRHLAQVSYEDALLYKEAALLPEVWNAAKTIFKKHMVPSTELLSKTLIGDKYTNAWMSKAKKAYQMGADKFKSMSTAGKLWSAAGVGAAAGLGLSGLHSLFSRKRPAYPPYPYYY